MRRAILTGVAACALLIGITPAKAACDDRYPATCMGMSQSVHHDRAASRHVRHRAVVARQTSPAREKNARAVLDGARTGGQASVVRGGLVTVSTAANINITVAANLADRFVGFIADLVAAGHKPHSIGCYARSGHIPGSNHYYGAACDIDQTARNRAAGYMFHVADLTQKWGLTNGCSWRNPDCGHVEVPQHAYAGTRVRYAHVHHVRHYRHVTKG